MTTPDESPVDRDETRPDRPRRTAALVAGGVVALLLVVALVALAVGRPGDDASGGASGDPGTTGAGASPTATDAAGATPTEPPGTPADKEAPPVALDASPALVEGVTLRVESLVATDGTAALPGESQGPAVAVALVVENARAEAVDLSALVVNVYGGSGRIPGNPLSTGTSPLPMTLAAGETARGSYVFTVPADARDDVRVTVDPAVDLPTVVFEGGASAG